jgi:uncharacterized protein YbjT (DUF2867 family)
VDWLSDGGATALITAGYENAAYDLTAGVLSFGDMAAILSKVKGRRIRHVPISENSATGDSREDEPSQVPDRWLDQELFSCPGWQVC